MGPAKRVANCNLCPIGKHVSLCYCVFGNVQEENATDIHVSTNQNRHCSRLSHLHQVPLPVITPTDDPNHKPGEEPCQESSTHTTRRYLYTKCTTRVLNTHRKASDHTPFSSVLSSLSTVSLKCTHARHQTHLILSPATHTPPGWHLPSFRGFATESHCAPRRSAHSWDGQAASDFTRGFQRAHPKLLPPEE